MPARSTAEMWTNTSLPPSSGWMKPKPLVSLNHLTVPMLIGIPYHFRQNKQVGRMHRTHSFVNRRKWERCRAVALLWRRGRISGQRSICDLYANDDEITT